MIEAFSNWLVLDLLGLSGRFGSATQFFVYDSIKILLLLTVMIFVIGTLRTYISSQRVNQLLSGRRAGVGNFFAATFGAITPFCSCSSIPIFMSFLEMGVPLGVALSFLITSPLINEYLVVLMLGYFGLRITLYYIAAGLLLGILSGLFLGTLGLEKHLAADIAYGPMRDRKYPDFKSRLAFGWREAKKIVGRIWAWVLLGVGVGALLHNYVPAEAIQALVARGGIFAVPIATLVGVPLYANCAAIVPVAVVLFQKGVPLGTALAFMMSTAALSLPEAVILKRVMNLRLLGIFFGTVALGIMLIGYAINFLA